MWVARLRPSAFQSRILWTRTCVSIDLQSRKPSWKEQRLSYSSVGAKFMEKHLVGFCIFLLTFLVGVSAVNPRLVFQEEEEFRCFAYSAAHAERMADRSR